MSARDDYPALVNEATLDQGATQLSHECARALEEIKRLRLWIATLAERRPTDTAEAEPKASPDQ